MERFAMWLRILQPKLGESHYHIWKLVAPVCHCPMPPFLKDRPTALPIRLSKIVSAHVSASDGGSSESRGWHAKCLQVPFELRKANPESLPRLLSPNQQDSLEYLMSFNKKKMMKLMQWGGMRMLIRDRQVLFCSISIHSAVAYAPPWGVDTQHFQTAQGFAFCWTSWLRAPVRSSRAGVRVHPSKMFRPIGKDRTRVCFTSTSIKQNLRSSWVIYKWYKSTSSAKSSGDGSQGYTSSGRPLESPALLECLYVRRFTAVRK